MATFGDLQAAASSRRDPADDGEESGDDDSDDEEYLPPGLGDDEASSCSEESASGDDEEGGGENDEGARKPAVRAKKVAGKAPGRQRRRGPMAAGIGGSGSRARRGGIRLDDEVVESQAASTVAAPAELTEAASSAPQLPDPSEEKSQKRAADLYASFLSDVGARPAAAAAATAASDFVAKVTTPTTTTTKTPASRSAITAPTTKTKVFDFAGESVTVEVPAAPPSSTSAAGAASSASAKRPSAVGGGVQSLLERLSKRPKLSTLEKSRMDWETFKSAEGISEDLAAHNRGRGGFLEKRAFLERADYRQFELERDARLSSSRQGQGGGGGGRKP